MRQNGTMAVSATAKNIARVSLICSPHRSPTRACETSSYHETRRVPSPSKPTDSAGGVNAAEDHAELGLRAEDVHLEALATSHWSHAGLHHHGGLLHHCGLLHHRLPVSRLLLGNSRSYRQVTKPGHTASHHVWHHVVWSQIV